MDARLVEIYQFTLPSGRVFMCNDECSYFFRVFSGEQLPRKKVKIGEIKLSELATWEEIYNHIEPLLCKYKI